ncbi:MAG: alpha amylase C-terminal domain-containing protein [Hyphomonadaceae bacterium]|nr:alpha amylase C-terminal domain-containing protein [Hyphomonadaceae bacterium]
MFRPILIALFGALSLVACDRQAATDPYAPRPYVELTHPEWARDAVIYQINTRQFTPEGTFNAARAQLPRLQALGVDILWLMPIHEIGVQNRKGTLGSPYSVRDYYSVNPEFGTMADFRAFVDEAHQLGMYVILDWVANHTAWDNPLVSEHPEWYERDWKGDFHPTPWWDWSDIIDLDYDQPGLRRYMTEAMIYWVREADIDGYRADVAGYVPLDFWETVRRELDAIKPVFMLAEFDQRDVHARAFDATYAWEWNNSMHALAMGRADVGALFGYYSGNQSAWPEDAYRMVYTSNHDQNAWDATEFERFGPAVQAAMVLQFVGEGIPSIYNGQEAGNEEQLEFFEREPIQWREHPHGELLRRLISLKHETRALWNGAAGARMIPVVNSAPMHVFSFARFDDHGGVFAVFNFTGQSQRVTFQHNLHHGDFVEYFSTEAARFDAATELTLPAWSYRVYVRRTPP